MPAALRFPAPRTDVAIEFLLAMFPERWDLAAIPPDGGRPEFKTFSPAETTHAVSWIDEHQGTSGVYYHINELRSGVLNKKATKADIAKVRYLHADVDTADEITLQSIRLFVPTPTVIVFSGGGYQPIWALHEPSFEFDRVEQINKSIAASLGGDNCHNIDRLLRLPGTINMPNAKKRAAGRVPTLAGIV